MEIILKNLNAGYFINKKEYSIVIENLNIVFESGKFHFLAGVSEAENPHCLKLYVI